MPSPTPYPRPSPYAPPRQETIAGRGARIGAGVVGGPYGVGMIPNIFHDIMNGVRTGQRASSRRAWQRYMASRSQSSGNLPDPFADMEHGNLTGDYRNTILGGEWTSDPDFEAPPDPNYYPHGLHGDDGRLDAASLAGDYNDNPDDPAEFNLDAYIATHGPQQSPGAPIGQHSDYHGDIRNFGGSFNLGSNLSLFNGIPSGYGTRGPTFRVETPLGATEYNGEPLPQEHAPGTNWGTMSPAEIRQYQQTHDNAGNPLGGGHVSGGGSPGESTPAGMTIIGHDTRNGQPIYRDANGNLFVNPGTGTPVTYHFNYGTGQMERDHPGDGSEFDVEAASNALTSSNFNGNTGDEGHDMFQLVMGQPTWQLDPHTGAMMHNGPIWRGHTSGSPVLGGDLTHEQLMLAQQLLQGNLTGGG